MIQSSQEKHVNLSQNGNKQIVANSSIHKTEICFLFLNENLIIVSFFVYLLLLLLFFYIFIQQL